MRFRDLPQPFVCGVLINEPTVAGVLRSMKLSEYDGADALDLEMQTLDEDQRTPAALAPVFRHATRPIFTVYRRYVMRGSAFAEEPIDDDVRMRAQLDLIDHGSMGFDMELDTFDPRPGPSSQTDEGKRYNYDRDSAPREVSTNPRAVDRQRELIAEAHRRGGEVLASTHTLTRLRPEAALQIGRLSEERGADALKIVQFCASYEDVLECLYSSVLLERELSIPFVVMAMGEYGKLVRPLAPLFGSMLVFARNDYAIGSFLDQPPIRSMRALYSNVDFKISGRAAEFLPPELAAASGDGAALLAALRGERHA